MTNTKYINVLSLGYCCPVALALEKLGLRNFSSPFDWVISDFRGVLNLIKNDFKDFLLYDNIYQNEFHRHIYKDMLYNIEYFHDFNNYQNLQTQLPKVRAKYNKRIKVFREAIREPTLFIRYIQDNKSCNHEEMIWVKDNYNNILELLKSFNPNNEILFITHSDVKINLPNLFYVRKDENDSVSRNILSSNNNLKNLLLNINIPSKRKNLIFYRKKLCEKYLPNNFYKRRFEEIRRLCCKILNKEYCHVKIC